jgi:hypothetical protein
MAGEQETKRGCQERGGNPEQQAGWRETGPVADQADQEQECEKGQSAAGAV